MPTTTEKSARVRGDLLVRLRSGHKNPALRTQQGLATHSDGMATRTVARAEDGYASFETVERLALTLGVSPWELWIPLDEEAEAPSRAGELGSAPASAAAPDWAVQQFEQLQAGQQKILREIAKLRTKARKK